MVEDEQRLSRRCVRASCGHSLSLQITQHEEEELVSMGQQQQALKGTETAGTAATAEAAAAAAVPQETLLSSYELPRDVLATTAGHLWTPISVAAPAAKLCPVLPAARDSRGALARALLAEVGTSRGLSRFDPSRCRAFLLNHPRARAAFTAFTAAAAHEDRSALSLSALSLSHPQLLQAPAGVSLTRVFHSLPSSSAAALMSPSAATGVLRDPLLSLDPEARLPAASEAASGFAYARTLSDAAAAWSVESQHGLWVVLSFLAQPRQAQQQQQTHHQSQAALARSQRSGHADSLPLPTSHKQQRLPASGKIDEEAEAVAALIASSGSGDVSIDMDAAMAAQLARAGDTEDLLDRVPAAEMHRSRLLPCLLINLQG